MERSKTDIVLGYCYPVLLVVAMFTGFGNMPIYKRYYISAIPGLGWSGNFYLNLNVHYIAGSMLLGIAFYFLLVHLRYYASDNRMTGTGKFRALFLGLTLLSGVLLALRNFSSIHYALGTQTAVAFLHLGAAMILLLLSVIFAIAKRPWRLGTDRPGDTP